jgi:hypothetical protein
MDEPSLYGESMTGHLANGFVNGPVRVRWPSALELPTSEH